MLVRGYYVPNMCLVYNGHSVNIPLFFLVPTTTAWNLKEF